MFVKARHDIRLKGARCSLRGTACSSLWGKVFVCGGQIVRNRFSAVSYAGFKAAKVRYASS